MRLSLTIRVLVAIATAAPLLAFLIPGAFMLLVSLGLWDVVSAGLDPRQTESIGWSALFILGYLLAANHLCLTIFYLWHINSSPSLSIPLRIAMVAAVLAVPLISMPIYYLRYIVPMPVQAVSRDHQAA